MRADMLLVPLPSQVFEQRENPNNANNNGREPSTNGSSTSSGGSSGGSGTAGRAQRIFPMMLSSRALRTISAAGALPPFMTGHMFRSSYLDGKPAMKPLPDKGASLGIQVRGAAGAGW